MRKRILIWGNGNTLKQNRCWLDQLYDVVGITSSDVEGGISGLIHDPLTALALEYDFIMVVSCFYEEIKHDLITKYGVVESKIRNFVDEFNEERFVEFGNKNKNVTFYVLRGHWQEKSNGLFNFYIRAVMTFYHAREKGYELLIDLKNYYTEYAGERYGKVNVWEDCFCQPTSYTLEEVYESKNVILSKFNDEVYNDFADYTIHDLSSKCFVETFCLLSRTCKGSFCLNREMELRVISEERKFAGKGRVLGVLARGTDMVYLKPARHFIPCTTEKFIKLVEAHMTYGKYQYLYLATEDSDILKIFSEYFGEHLITTDQWRTSQTGSNVLMMVKSGRKNEEYLRESEYCLVISMLAKCDSLVANTMCGGVAGAILLNEGAYNSIDVLDEGVYK